jgi:FixJ family two-component response regulator
VDTSDPRIAIVDDQPSVCLALARLLRLNGFAVDTYPSGEEFLASLTERIPSCLILDLQMPGLNGFDVMRRLEAESLPIPIVAITGFDSRSARERAQSAGAVVYLPKPVGEEDLLAAIERSTGRRPDQTAKNGSSGARMNQISTKEQT